MKIFFTGGTGFVGDKLVRGLMAQGNDVTVVSRSYRAQSRLPQGVSLIQGSPTEKGAWQEKLKEQDVVINLAGESIFQRWTRQTKKTIRESRILTTRNLVEGLFGRQGGETLLISASAVGYYGFHGDEELSEDSPPGDDFLASVSRQWEEEAHKAVNLGVRVAICRLGIVLGKGGGALGQLLPIFRKGLGSPIGSGKQWFSWVHEQDVVNVCRFLIENKQLSGPINCVSPNPVRNRELTKALGSVLGKPTFLPAVPAFLVRLKMGEFGYVLTNGQRVMPKRLLKSGFKFQFPELKDSLEDILCTRKPDISLD